ncbi:MAG: PKD domain-containing protein, partial [Flavobacteriales bacterium]|nr:PKD domain-containing protein [Flavobacteriales bacterium]
MKLYRFFIYVTLVTNYLSAQTIQLNQTDIKTYHTILKENFHDFDIVSIPANHGLEKDLKHYTIEENYTSVLLFIEKTKITDPKYDDKGIMTYRGYVEETDQSVALTTYESSIYGYIEQEGYTVYVEPLSYYVKGVTQDLHLVYKDLDVKPKAGRQCAALEHSEKQQRMNKAAKSAGNCWQVDLAIASDYLMLQRYGSVGAVEAHNIGVMNNVMGNWDNEFADEIQFIIVEQFVSNCSSCDPWTSNTDANVLLDDFRLWGNSGGFNTSFDIGQLWTARDLDGPTIGLAWVGAVCTSFKYHLLEDFSSDAQLLRVLTSHEIGHNFDAYHDAQGSPHIMAPAVQYTSSWSSATVSSIDSYIGNGLPCTSSCTSIPPAPTANFSSSNSTGCVTHQVQFTDQSTNNPTSWNWTFQGGTPSSSNLQNPVVNYSSAGSFDVTLTVSNLGGTNTITKQAYVTIEQPPTADFSHNLIASYVQFNNLSSSNATSFLWSFGDGNSSSQQSPIHQYQNQGIYVVSLTALNNCGLQVHTDTISTYTSPSADFTASDSSICVGDTINFYNNSSNNTTSLSWIFQNGFPAATGLTNPSVIYNSAGNYDVTLIAQNPAGVDTIKKSLFVQVKAQPTVNYSFLMDTTSVQFLNGSSHYDSLLWSFGDSTTSSEDTVIHIYDTCGTFSASLELYAECGHVLDSFDVIIIEKPEIKLDSIQHVLCHSDSNGYIRISVEGCGEPYQFFWSNGASTKEISQLTAGSYAVTVINSIGDSALSNFSVTEPSLLNASVDSLEHIHCNNSIGYVEIQVSGGAGSYQFSWDNGTSSNPNQLYEGTHSVTITDQNGCQNTLNASIDSIIDPTLNLTAQNVSCYGLQDGSVSSLVTNGQAPFAYSWSNGSTNTSQSGLGAQQLSVVLTDQNNCTDSASITISEPDSLTLQMNPSAIHCNNILGSIQTLVTGGTVSYSYVWSNGDTSNVLNAHKGSYSLTVTDANLCSIVGTSIIDSIIDPKLTLTTQDVTCYGLSNGSVNSVVTNGKAPFGYVWSNGSTNTNQSGLSAQQLYVIITDQNNCTDSASVVISEPDSLALQMITSPVDCNNNLGSISTVISGGTASFSYNWSTGDTSNFLNAYEGSYSLTVTDANLCSNTGIAS